MNYAKKLLTNLQLLFNNLHKAKASLLYKALLVILPNSISVGNAKLQ